MNMLAFIVSLMAVMVIGHVTATNFGFGSSYYLPSLSYPSSGLWSGGWGGGYSHGSGFGGFKFHSSGYLPKVVQKPVPVSLEGGYGNGNEFWNDGLIVLVLLLVLFRLIRTYWMPTTSERDVIIF